MNQTKEDVLASLEATIQRGLQASGGDPAPIKPDHRHVFHWPPHAVSHDYHITNDLWSESSEITVHGDTWPIQIATTDRGVFGRVEGLWNESRGETREEMLSELVGGCEPWYARRFAIQKALGRDEIYRGRTADLPSGDLVSLLFCPDRDVAHTAMIEIEKRASLGIYTEAFLRILEDERHPHRRSAQWCVLDMFEDIAAFCRTPEEVKRAVTAIKNLLWNAQDDFARTMYKGGVVLGGHISNNDAADALIELIGAPSKIGRRSAIHAVFHLVEWLPDRQADVLAKLQWAAENDPEPQLRTFAESQARDIASGATDHVEEPTFEEEKAAARV